MDKARAFFYVAAGVLMLALAVLIGFHLGARNATAQAQATQAFVLAGVPFAPNQYLV